MVPTLLIRLAALLASLVVVLLSATPASAVTLQLDPETPVTPTTLATLHRDQARIDASLMPWPEVIVRVIYMSPACNGAAQACSGDHQLSIEPGANATTVLHETAHAAVDYAIDDVDRAAWTALVGGTDWWDFTPGATMPGEQFAVAWANCAQYARVGSKRCAHLLDLAARKGWTGGMTMAERQRAATDRHKARPDRCVRLKLRAERTSSARTLKRIRAARKRAHCVRIR